MSVESSSALRLPEGTDTESMLRSLSQEAMLSALIVGCMPIVVMAVLLVLNRGYIAELWSSARGLAVMAGAFVLWFCGILTMFWMGRPPLELSAEQLQHWGGKLGSRLTVPMIVFVLPAMFVILIGPAALQVLEGKTHIPPNPVGCERP